MTWLEPALSPWIADVEVMHALPPRERPWRRLPGAMTSLVFCSDERGPRLSLSGPASRAAYKPGGLVPTYVRFTFQPGVARSVLGIDLGELTDRAVPADEVLGRRASELRVQLAALEGEPGRSTRAMATLLTGLVRAAEPDRSCQLLGEALRRLESAPARVSRLAASLDLSERRLRQLFHERLGLSPKRYARIVRLRRALARAGEVGWADLAVEAGFYDQAHLIGEFKALLGVTPSDYLAGNVPALSIGRC